jgi:hypothetical protein
MPHGLLICPKSCHGLSLVGTDWLERLEGEQLTLRKREFGRLSKKKQTMKVLRYHHAPALALLPTGQVLAAWQAAEGAEGEAGQRVQVATSDDEGRTWALSWELPVPRRAAQWSPIPHVDAAGRPATYCPPRHSTDSEPSLLQ